MDRETCVDCGKEAPPTETNYTLISAQFGWRLTRAKTAAGDLIVEWRCPVCWREYKRLKPGTITGNLEDRSTVPPPAASSSLPPPRPTSPPKAAAPRPSTAPAKASPRRQPSPPADKRPPPPARRRPT